MQISNDVLAVLSNVKTDGNKLTIDAQLDRALYLKTNKVIEAAGGKWNRKEKSHIFDGDAGARIDEVMLTGSVSVPKDDFNFFPTSSKVIDQMFSDLIINDQDRVLEPSCGDGRIVKAISKVSKAKIVAVEFDENRVKSLQNDPSFIETNAKLIHSDFLAYKDEEKFDVILMNPPFKNKSDVKHTDHALDLLKQDGGRLRGIMSAGVLFREDKLTTEFRNRVASLGGTFIELEDQSFKESGTMVRTVLLEINL